jgi:2-polyprenyl-3-methyl-5-hydroxy-6-metoxy-1,4-benzoquinol methylase/predicted RNA-binding Zn-ribbon protein involved in translation (DUF1610 family)
MTQPTLNYSRATPVAMWPCPMCGKASRLFAERFRTGQTWHVYRCRRCAHGFLSERPGDEVLAREYGGKTYEKSTPEEVRRRFDPREDCDTLAATTARLADRLHGRPGDVGRAHPRGDVLDVGSGDGVVAYHFARYGFVPTLIEYTDLPTQILPITGGTFHQLPFEQTTLQSLGRSRGFDAILMSQVLEHSRDPLDWLVRARDLLADRGVLSVSVPNFNGVYRLLGRRDPYIIPPQHISYFSARSLEMAFAKSGLKLLHRETRSRIPVRSANHASGWPRVLACKVWNRICPVLNSTMLGIGLRHWAVRA